MLTIVKAVVDFELFETWRRKETMMLVALSTRLITCASSYLRERVWVVWNLKILMSKNIFEKSSNLGGLHSRPDHRKDQDKHSLLPALGDTLETKEEDNREMLKDGDEPEQWQW